MGEQATVPVGESRLSKRGAPPAREDAPFGRYPTGVDGDPAFNGIRRFDDMRVRTSIPRQVLSDRLGRLVDEGVLRREPYREPGRRQRHEYRLANKGFELYPILVALNDWGTPTTPSPQGSPLEFEHRDCGGTVGARLHCTHGHDVDDHRDVVPRPGPGAHRRAA